MGTLYFRNLIREAGTKTACLKQITAEANFYEEQACEIFKVAYNKNPNKAMKLLIRQSSALGKKTVLELAVESESLEFMALDGVQEKLRRVWKAEDEFTGDLKPSTTIDFGYMLAVTSPQLVYLYNCLFYFLFLILFSYVIMFKFCDQPTGNRSIMKIAKYYYKLVY